MSRWRVVEVTVDDGCFGYTAPPIEEVMADNLDRNQAKAICRHYDKELVKIGGYAQEITSYSVQVLNDEGDWEDCSTYWMYQEGAEFDAWVERKTGHNADNLLCSAGPDKTWHQIIKEAIGR